MRTTFVSSLLNGGGLENRLDTHFYLPQFQRILEKIKIGTHTQLGDIVLFSKDTTDFSEYPNGSFEYLEISGINLGINFYKTVTTEVKNAPSRAKMKTSIGDIVISTTRPHRGAIAEIINDGIIASTGFSIIREVSPQINKNWLLHVLLSELCLQQMLQRSSGGNYPAIIEDEIKSICIPIVSPEKQERMATTIKSALKERNAKHQESQNLLYEFEQRISTYFGLHNNPKSKICFAICLKDLDGVIDAKRYASMDKAISNFKVSDVCEVVDEKVNVARFEKQVIDWIRIDDLSNRPLDIEENRTQPANEVEGTFFEVQESDILVARLGPTILNQKIVMVRSLERTTIASAEFLVLRCKEGYNPETVMAVLKTEYYRDLMYSHARGSTPSRYRLNREDMLKLPFPDVRNHQEQIAIEANDVREQAKAMRIQAEREWQAAEEQFEKELLEG